MRSESSEVESLSKRLGDVARPGMVHLGCRGESSWIASSGSGGSDDTRDWSWYWCFGDGTSFRLELLLTLLELFCRDGCDVLLSRRGSADDRSLDGWEGLVLRSMDNQHLVVRILDDHPPVPSPSLPRLQLCLVLLVILKVDSIEECSRIDEFDGSDDRSTLPLRRVVHGSTRRSCSDERPIHRGLDDRCCSEL